MNESPKQVEVQIMGQSYLLTCPAQGEKALLAAVQRVDQAMCRIRDAGKIKARDRIAVLASLNLAFELVSRDANPSASEATSSNPQATSSTSGSHTDAPPSQALLKRLDQALSADGQLL